MNETPIPQDSVRVQYKDSNNLSARMNVHQLFSVNKYGWYPFVMDRLLRLPEKARILEIGGGTAALWMSEAHRVPEDWQITISDYSPGMARQAKAQLARKGRYQFLVSDAQTIPFSQDSFDGVVANHMLYHIPDCDRALAEVRRVLKPGGIFFAATNGMRHMEELHQLIIQFDRDMRATLGSFLREFNLENGGQQINRHFQTVNLDRYEDALEITEAQPLVNYMLSLTSLSASQRMREPGVIRAFTEAVETQIRQKGAFHIQKDTGLFIAS